MKYVLARNSQTDPDSQIPRLLRDPSIGAGQTASPMIFGTRKDAEKYKADNGLEAFYLLALSAPRDHSKGKGSK